MKAVIDLGTNTFNLLIGEMKDGKFVLIHSERVPVMLGMGGINEGVIAQDAYARAINALTKFKEKAEGYEISSITGYATSAVRGASNGQEFIDDVYNRLGIEIKLVSGPEEGLLIYKGVGLTHHFYETSVIMDIGGGSTEFVLADHDGFKRIVSLNIGVSRIYQSIGSPLNYTAEHHRQVYDFLEEAVGNELEGMNCSALVGASGTFETFYEMVEETQFKSHHISIEIPFDELMHVLEWSIHASYQERVDHPWIIDMRKKMLPVGAMKIKWVIEKLGIQRVWVSPYSLKEGAFIS